MRRKKTLLSLAAVALFTVHCVSSGVSRPTTLTNVDLKENNYRIVATGISGEASSGTVLGLAAPMGIMTSAIGVARVSGERDLQKAALADFCKNAEAQVGPVKGDNFALVNVINDGTAANWFGLYATQTVVIRADIVEFTSASK